jgi:hypothetical protein
VSLHENIPVEVNKFFASEPSNLKGGNWDPPWALGPPRPLG